MDFFINRISLYQILNLKDLDLQKLRSKFDNIPNIEFNFSNESKFNSTNTQNLRKYSEIKIGMESPISDRPVEFISSKSDQLRKSTKTEQIFNKTPSNIILCKENAKLTTSVSSPKMKKKQFKGTNNDILEKYGISTLKKRLSIKKGNKDQNLERDNSHKKFIKQISSRELKNYSVSLNSSEKVNHELSSSSKGK